MLSGTRCSTPSTPVNTSAPASAAVASVKCVETGAKETAGIEVSATLTNVKLGANGAVLSLGAGLAEVDPSALTQFNGKPN